MERMAARANSSLHPAACRSLARRLSRPWTAHPAAFLPSELNYHRVAGRAADLPDP
jgi:hypothetical protein